MTYQSINPYSGELLKTFDEMTNTALDTAIQTAQTCYNSWCKTSFKERAHIATQTAKNLRDNIDELSGLVTLEMGKRLEESKGEVLLSADIFDYYAENAEKFLAPAYLQCSSGQAMVQSAPIGVLFGIQPWNFPYYQLARFAAPNIMAGNVVMVKHAGCVPQCAQAFERMMLQAGAPAGLYTNVRVSYEQVDRIIDDPRIKGVALTGSVDAGKRVAAQAGKNMKKSTMELGGNDAFIVLEDADLEKTIPWAMWAKMNNTGQCCIAAKRFIVVAPVAEIFLQKFLAAMHSLQAGDPMVASTSLGPLSTRAALTGLVEQVERAVAHGATLLMGGKRIDRPGWFMEPTILTNVTRDNPAFKEEFFGPVAIMFTVENEQEAIDLANDSDFGLGGSVFTKDIERGKKVAAQIETGMVFVNHPTWTAANLPFGGIKNSGYGHELYSFGIQEFINKKLIRVEDIDAPA